MGASPSFGMQDRWHNIHTGDENIAFATWYDVKPRINTGFGTTEVNLSSLGTPPSDTTLDLTVSFGELVVTLPPDVRTVVDARVHLAGVEVNGQSVRSGIQPRYLETLSPGAAGPTLTLHITGGPGSVRIVQSGTPEKTPEPPGESVPTTPSIPDKVGTA